MRLSSLLSVAFYASLTFFTDGSSLGAAGAGAAIAVRDPKTSGSLSLVVGKKLFTFRYSTKKSNAKNWIGIYYPFYGAPDDEKYVGDSLAWAYADKKSGEAQVDVSGLVPGNYKAYFLAKNGYKWLAKPIDVVLPGAGPTKFVTDKFTTHNARRGEAFSANVGGLIANPKDNDTKFFKVQSEAGGRGGRGGGGGGGGGGGDDWVNVAENGAISGTPGKSASNTTVLIRAAGSDGNNATLRIMIPVRPADQPLVEKLRVMSYNMWFGGLKVDDFHAKQLRFLLNSNVDIVGLQECWNGHAIRLGRALGWHYWQSHEVGVLSRYPIVETYPEQQAGGSVRISLGGDKNQIIVWNVHLGYNPYGPYDFCFNKMPLEQVLDREAESGRTPQIVEVIKAMRSKLNDANDIPVLLTGDFNAPSHLDWTASNGNAHCNAGYVPWPSSVYPINAGLIDSFRQRYPDPISSPGSTWSPIYLDNDGRPEPMDRIDFIYHKGDMLQVLDSQAVMVGNPTAEPNHQQNEWTSDHKAVLTTYRMGASSYTEEL